VIVINYTLEIDLDSLTLPEGGLDKISAEISAAVAMVLEPIGQSVLDGSMFTPPTRIKSSGKLRKP
jgi:hypothetical protein